MAVQYKCPECEKALRVASPVAAGKKIKCPACANVFAPAPLGDASSSSSANAAVQAGKPRPTPKKDEDGKASPDRARGKSDAASERRNPKRAIDDEDGDGEKPRRKKKKKKSKASNAPLIIGLASAGAVLVVLGITGFVWPGFFLSGDNAVAKAGNPGPTAGKVPNPGPVPGPGGMPGTGPMPGPLPTPGTGPMTGPLPTPGTGPMTGPLQTPGTGPMTGPLPTPGPGPMTGPLPTPGTGPMTGPLPTPGTGPMTGPLPTPGTGPKPGLPPMPVGGSWEALDRKELGFKVMMPGKAVSKAQFLGGVKQDIFVVEQGSGAYLVFHQINGRVEAGTERALLVAAVNGLGAKGRVTSQDFKTIQGYSAVEVLAELRIPAGGMIKDLIIVANDRMYQVMVAGTADFVRSADTQKFISSFQITK